MNILSVTNALKEIKLKELDDEFQINIAATLNTHLPDTVTVSGESSGDDIRTMIDTAIDAVSRVQLLGIEFISGQQAVVRFYNNVEKVQQSKIRHVEYDDAIKGNFFSTCSFFIIIVVLVLVGIYEATDSTRGKIPESRILTVLDYAVQSLADMHGGDTVTELIENEPSESESK